MTVRAAFIEPMLRNFEEPPGIDSAGFFADLEDELCAYDDELLHEAYRHIRQTYKFRKFPTIAQCLAACQQVPRPGSESTVTQTEKQREEAADKARRRYRACGMIRGSELGREALDHRWLGLLIEFAAEHQRMPEEQEIRDMQWRRDETERNLEAIRLAEARDRDKPRIYDGLSRLRRSMQRRAERDVFGVVTAEPPAPPPLNLRELREADERRRLDELADRLRDKPLPLLSPTALNRRGTVAAE